MWGIQTHRGRGNPGQQRMRSAADQFADGSEEQMGLCGKSSLFFSWRESFAIPDDLIDPGKLDYVRILHFRR